MHSFKINREFFTLIHSFTQTIQTYTQEKKQYLSASAISKAPITLVSKCQLDTKNTQLQQTLMSADYYRATNRILSKRAERDLNAFPLTQCCNSWMLGNKFQTSFPSLHSRGCFILKQMKNLRQSDLCREQGTFTDITCICICTHRHTGQILQTLKAIFSPHYHCNGVCEAAQPATCTSASAKPQLVCSHCRDCNGSSFPESL